MCIPWWAAWNWVKIAVLQTKRQSTMSLQLLFYLPTGYINADDSHGIPFVHVSLLQTQMLSVRARSNLSVIVCTLQELLEYVNSIIFVIWLKIFVHCAARIKSCAIKRNEKGSRNAQKHIANGWSFVVAGANKHTLWLLFRYIMYVYVYVYVQTR